VAWFDSAQIVVAAVVVIVTSALSEDTTARAVEWALAYRRITARDW
jgi:hypothetical protein